MGSDLQNPLLLIGRSDLSGPGCGRENPSAAIEQSSVPDEAVATPERSDHI